MNRLEQLLKDEQTNFSPVVDFNAGKDTLIALDFTANNTTLTDEVLNDTEEFSLYIDKKLQQTGARYGIGGYAEHRTIYSRSKVFDDTEPRRLHLGTDIWGEALTSVMCPIDGVVHSVGFNDQMGDYGATIILSHQLKRISFYTLYGHLSLSSIQKLQPGECIERGKGFTEFGIPAENGSWPPHLHFQLIIDIGNRKGDYPGVCKYSEKDDWLANGADPDLILQMNQYISL